MVPAIWVELSLGADLATLILGGYALYLHAQDSSIAELLIGESPPAATASPDEQDLARRKARGELLIGEEPPSLVGTRLDEQALAKRKARRAAGLRLERRMTLYLIGLALVVLPSLLIPILGKTTTATASPPAVSSQAIQRVADALQSQSAATTSLTKSLGELNLQPQPAPPPPSRLDEPFPQRASWFEATLHILILALGLFLFLGRDALAGMAFNRWRPNGRVRGQAPDRPNG
jgi:hypothetical protein